MVKTKTEDIEYEPTLEVEPSEELVRRRKEKKGKRHKPKHVEVEDTEYVESGDIDTGIRYTYERCYTTIETIGQKIYVGPVDTSKIFTESVDDMENLLQVNVRKT